jgi:hypothetical protein
MDARTENKIFYRALLIALGISGMLVIGYLLVGEELIRKAYEGSSFGGLVKPRTPDSRTFEQYLADSTPRFWRNAVAGLPLSVIALFLLFKLYRALLRQLDRAPKILSLPEYDVRNGVWIATGTYVVLTILLFAPLLSIFTRNMIGPPGDNTACYWTLNWAYDHIFHGNQGFGYINDILYPEGSTFYLHAWSYYNLYLFFGLRQLFEPVTCYNVLTLHSFVLAGAGAYLLAKYFFRNHWLALLAGMLFAFNPAHIERAVHHMNIATIQFVPLFVLFYIRAIRGKSRADLVLAAAFLLLNALVDWNYLIFGIWFMIFSYIYLAIRRKKWWLWDVAWRSAAPVTAVILLLSPLILPMIQSATSGKLSGMGGHNAFVVDISALFTPFPRHLLGDIDLVGAINNTHTSWSSENTGYLGLVALAIFVWQFRPIVTEFGALLLGGVSFLLMSFGAQPHLFGWLIPALTPERIVPLIPVLSNSRAPSRFIVFVYLFWSLVIAAAIGKVWQKLKDSPSRRYVVVGGLVLLLGADYYGSITESTPVELPKCYAALETTGEQFGILDLPGGYVPSARYMMYQSMHGHPIVQGWVSRRAGATLLDRLELEDLVRQRRQLDFASVKYIVIHRQFLPDSTVSLDQYVRTYPTVYSDSLNVVLKVF